MTSDERHELRYQRRREARLRRKQERSDSIGGVESAMTYHDLYKYGKACCSNV